MSNEFAHPMSLSILVWNLKFIIVNYGVIIFQQDDIFPISTFLDP